MGSLPGAVAGRGLIAPAAEHLGDFDLQDDGHLARVDRAPCLERVANDLKEALAGPAGLGVVFFRQVQQAPFRELIGDFSKTAAPICLRF